MFRDHLGSARGVVESTDCALRSVYRPFGQTEKWEDPDPSVAHESHHTIVERRDDTGLMYLNARYYDPALGHFLSPDWFPVTMPGVGVHRYGYAGFDPVNQLDPGGNRWAADAGVGGPLNQEGEDLLDTYSTCRCSGDRDWWQAGDHSHAAYAAEEARIIGEMESSLATHGGSVGFDDWLNDWRNTPVQDRRSGGSPAGDAFIAQMAFGGYEGWAEPAAIIAGGPLFRPIGQTRALAGSRTVDELIQGSSTLRNTMGRTTLYSRNRVGGWDAALRDFNALRNGAPVREITTSYGTGYRSMLPNNHTLVVRPGSSGLGNPVTLEIRNPVNRRGIEVRYFE